MDSVQAVWVVNRDVLVFWLPHVDDGWCLNNDLFVDQINQDVELRFNNISICWRQTWQGEMYHETKCSASRNASDLPDLVLSSYPHHSLSLFSPSHTCSLFPLFLSHSLSLCTHTHTYTQTEGSGLSFENCTPGDMSVLHYQKTVTFSTQP